MDANHLVLVPIGLVAGMLGGLLGIGGSVLMIPAMMLVFDEPNQHLYQGAAMIVNFFVALPAVLQHYRARAILRSIVRVTIPAAGASVIVGVMLSNGPWFRGDNEVFLSRTFGVFLLYTAAYNVYRLVSRQQFPDVKEADAAAIPTWKIAATVGVPMGVVGGLLGIGGGALAVPLQQVLLRMPLRKAIANSAVTIVLVSLIGATYKNYANAQVGIPFSGAAVLALCLIPSAIVGAFIGGRLTHVLPRRALRVAVILLMCYGGVSLIRRPAKAEPAPAAAKIACHPAYAMGSPVVAPAGYLLSSRGRHSPSLAAPASGDGPAQILRELPSDTDPRRPFSSDGLNVPPRQRR